MKEGKEWTKTKGRGAMKWVSDGKCFDAEERQKSCLCSHLD